MAISFTENIFKTRYKDDFADSAGYHRILFNPRKALQARELTQMQTIIQREVERFGKNIFKEGASVSSGGMVINSNYEFVKIQQVCEIRQITFEICFILFICCVEGFSHFSTRDL